MQRISPVLILGTALPLLAVIPCVAWSEEPPAASVILRGTTHTATPVDAVALRGTTTHTAAAVPEATGQLKGTLGDARAAWQEAPRIKAAKPAEAPQPSAAAPRTGTLRNTLGSDMVEDIPEPEILGLGEAVDFGMDRNGKIKAADDDVKAANAAVWQQIAAFVPVVTASAAAGRDYNQTLSNERYSDRALGLQLTVPLFTSGQRLFNWRGANSSLSAARAESEIARNEIALDIISAYINWVSAKRISKLIAKNVQTLERLLAAVDAKRREGFASDTDRAQVLADLTSLKSQLVGAQLNQAKARETLASHVGGAEVREDFDARALEEPLAAGVDALVESAMVSNPNLDAALHASDAERERSYAAVSGLLPQVSLNARYNHELEHVSPEIDRDDWSIEVRGTVPLLDLTSVGEVARTRYVASAASHRAAETRRTVELEVRQLWQEVVSLRQQMALAAKRVENRRQVAASLNEQYKIGLVSLDVMLDRQRLLTSSEVELVQIEVQRAVAVNRLLLTTGQFSTSLLLAHGTGEPRQKLSQLRD